MTQTLYVDRNHPAAVLMLRAFPSYTGRKFQLAIQDHGMSLQSYWDGGSRDYYQIIRLADMALAGIPQNGTVFDGLDLSHSPVPADGFAVVMHCIFQGKDLGLRLHIHSINAPKYLPAPVELTEAEKIVLQYTSRYKPSYGGKDRYDMYAADCAYSGKAAIASREHWEAVKAILAGRGLLNGKGAITTAGKNALGA